MTQEKQNPTGPGTRQAEDKGDKENHYIVRAHALPPDDNAPEEKKRIFEEDSFISRSLGEEMHQSGAYANILHRENGPAELAETMRQGRDAGILLLCFKNDEPTGMLAASVSYLLDLDYILSLCTFLYVRPLDRDGKSAALLMQAFRQWSELRKADEMRFSVTSLDNIEKTHDMMSAIDFAHMGGNYAFPLTEKGQSVLTPHQPISGKTLKTDA